MGFLWDWQSGYGFVQSIVPNLIKRSSKWVICMIPLQGIFGALKEIFSSKLQLIKHLVPGWHWYLWSLGSITARRKKFITVWRLQSLDSPHASSLLFHMLVFEDMISQLPTWATCCRAVSNIKHVNTLKIIIQNELLLLVVLVMTFYHNNIK